MSQVCSLHCRYELIGRRVDGESFVPLVTVHPLCPHNSHHNIKPHHESSVQKCRDLHFTSFFSESNEGDIVLHVDIF